MTLTRLVTYFLIVPDKNGKEERPRKMFNFTITDESLLINQKRKRKEKKAKNMLLLLPPQGYYMCYPDQDRQESWKVH